METEKKKRGRPPKNGAKDPWFLARTLEIIYAYDKARTSGIKHSAAIREAVAFVRHLDPEMHVSETEVRRVLAVLRPSDGPVALLSSYEILEGEEAAEIRNRFAETHAFNRSRSQLSAPDEDPTRPLKRFSIYLVKRRNYPRHNAKSSSR